MKLLYTYGRNKKAAAAAIESIERRGSVNTSKVAPTVRRIIADIRSQGDAALLRYARKLDRLPREASIAVSRQEMAAAWKATSPELREAMQEARRNIQAFAQAQMPSAWTISPARGVKTGQVVRPLSSVGCYVPGGRYPLPSTLFMTVTPAQVAGVSRIVVCSPNPARETLAAAWLAGVTEFYRIGGAQAIAALAYGTATVSPVDKIVGPGNLFVTAAKQLVSSDCGIDMPAGPTEIGIASETGDPSGLASDLIAQAEHDPEALAVLITSSSTLASSVLAEVKSQSSANPAAQVSLKAQGFIFVTSTVEEARDLTNLLAFEHLTIDTAADLKWVRNAGSVFIGDYSPQSMGDYISGPNHVLPTGRNGRLRGGLSVLDFVKIITVQEYTRAGLRKLGPHAIALAEAEGLKGHAQSVRVKMQ